MLRLFIDSSTGFTRTILVKPHRGPNERRIPIDGDFIDGIGFNVVDIALLKRTPFETGSDSSLVLDALDTRTPAAPPGGFVYEQRRPELGTLYQVVRDNLQTLYAAVEEGFTSPLPEFVRSELERYLAGIRSSDVG